MDNWKSVLEALRIKICYYEIGSKDKFLDLVKRHSIINCSRLTNPSNTSIFTKQIGGKGEIILDFIPETELDNDFKEFEEFQLYRRVHAVIAFGDCKDATGELIKKFNDQFGNDFVVRRCYLIGDGRPEGLKDSDCSIIPNDEKLNENIGKVIEELCGSILRTFERMSLEFNKLTLIDSPREHDKKFASDQSGRLTLRTAGRLAKLAGDLYLLAGAFDEAVAILATAADETKLNGDLLWYASAQEALQIAMVCQSEMVLSNGNVSKKDTANIIWIALPDRLREVAPLYLKADMAILAFEMHRTISTLLEFAGSSAESAMALGHGWAVHKQLLFADKLYALAIIIKRFESLGMGRKRAFYLQSLSMLIASSKETSMALSILEKTFSVYKIDLNYVDKCNWMDLKISILRKCTTLAESIRNQSTAVQLYTALLSYSAATIGKALIDGEEQNRIAQWLQSSHRRVYSGVYTFPCLLPILEMLDFDRNSPDLWTCNGADSDLISVKDTFIYNPFAKRNIPKVLPVAIAVGETLLLRFQLKNPFIFPLDLFGLCVTSEDLSIISERLDITLPVSKDSKEFSILVTPTVNGTLKITHLEASIFGVSMKIPCPQPLLISVIDRQPILKIVFENGTKYLSLIEGEQISFDLQISNFSEECIKDIKAQISNETDQVNTVNEILFKSSLDPIQIDSLPNEIPSKETAKLAIKVNGINGWKAGLISVIYQGLYNGSRYSKMCNFKVEGSVKEGVRVLSIGALPHQRHSGDVSDQMCLLFVDVENLMHEPLKFTLKDIRTGLETVSDQVCPGLSSRLLLSVPRFQINRSSLPVDYISNDLNGSDLARLRQSNLYEDAMSIDPILYQIKKLLLQHIEGSWKSVSSGRTGVFQWTKASINPSLYTYFAAPKVSISFEVSLNGPGPYPILEPFSFKISVKSQITDACLILRILPAIHISDDELGVDYEDFLTVDGTTQCIYHNGEFTHRLRILPLSPCRTRLLVHVENLKNGEIYSPQHPLLLDFIDSKE